MPSLPPDIPSISTTTRNSRRSSNNTVLHTLRTHHLLQTFHSLTSTLTSPFKRSSGSSSSSPSLRLPLLYPLQGILFFVTHPAFWPLFRRRLTPLLIISVLVYLTLFFWTFIPQWAFLTLFHGPAGAFFNALVLVLGEGAAVVSILFEAFLVDEVLVDVFDGVLVHTSQTALLTPFRLIHPPSPEHPSPVLRLGHPTHKPTTYSPFSFRQSLEFICLLPLNLVPIAGTPLFLLLTGARAGPLHHHRYFVLRGLNKKEKKAEIRKRRFGYTGFGMMALVLQLVPVLSMFFLLSSAAGSGLWVADLERQRERERRRREGLEEGLLDEEGVPQDEGVLGSAAAAGLGEVDADVDAVDLDVEAEAGAPPPPYTDDPL